MGEGGKWQIAKSHHGHVARDGQSAGLGFGDHAVGNHVGATEHGVNARVPGAQLGKPDTPIAQCRRRGHHTGGNVQNPQLGEALLKTQAASGRPVVTGNHDAGVAVAAGVQVVGHGSAHGFV